MRSPRSEEPGFEEMAIEREPELERQPAAAEGDTASELPYDVSPPPPGGFMAREGATMTWGGFETQISDYPQIVERLLGRLWYVMYALGEQQQEIVRLRDNTRQAHQRLGTA